MSIFIKKRKCTWNDPGFFTLPMDHPIAVENIRRHISDIKVIDDVFDEQARNDIWKSAFVDMGLPRYNRNGTVLIDSDLEQVYNRYKSIFDEHCNEAPKSPCVGGNYYITPQQYGLHNDSIRREGYKRMLETVPLNHSQRKYTPGKIFLIPLWVGTHFDEVDGGQIVAFTQRDIAWARVYNNKKQTQNIASIYDVVTDHSLIQFYDNKGAKIPKEKNSIPIDKELHKKWINSPPDRFEGLTVEAITEWKPGSVAIFDTVQLHCTNEGTKEKGYKTWNAKMGVFLQFLIPLDDDLLKDWQKEQNAL